MARILIVDDLAANRKLLCAILDAGRHTLIEAESGDQAIELARETLPDLVLLDVMMPGLDGFETAKQLKDLAGDEFVPIVLVTALSDNESRLRGLRIGADEFLCKPVNSAEVRVRVANLLALRSKDVALRSNEASLTRRNIELAELHRYKDELATMIVHDLKSPTAVILSNLDFLAESFPMMEPDLREALDDSRAAGRRTLRLLANLLDVARIEANQLDLRRTPLEVAALLEPITQQRSLIARARQIELSTAIEPRSQIEADGDLVTRVLENLLDNAFRYTPRGGQISVDAHASGPRLEIRVGNSGPPIPVSARARIFEKFGRVSPEAGRMNLGLGLYFCRLAIEAHCGRLWIEDGTTLPTVFALDLPIVSPSYA